MEGGEKKGGKNVRRSTKTPEEGRKCSDPAPKRKIATIGVSRSGMREGGPGADKAPKSDLNFPMLMDAVFQAFGKGEKTKRR